ncbi:MAG: S4 domain-containing protein, partial [Deltaproteobacteria bacterium]
MTTDEKSPPRPETPSGEVFATVTVEEEHGGKRLDRYLVDAVPDLSRARVKALIEAGEVRVDGRRARKGDAVSGGAVIEILAPPPPRDYSPVAVDDPAVIVRYEDDDVVVVEKPA